MKKSNILDNLHIVLWLIKDLCWSINSRLGVLLIPPTIIISVFLLFKQRHDRNSLWHNLAICSWIGANSTWMVSELYGLAYLKPVYILLFGVGLSILFMYYITESIEKIFGGDD